VNEGTRDEGDPTQQAPHLIAEIEQDLAQATAAFKVMPLAVRALVDTLEIIAARMERAVRRMEVLRQTMRPPMPIVDPAEDDRLSKGESVVLAALAAEGEDTDLTTLALRTGYAPGTLRTYIPMLRRRGLVQAERLALVQP
jgi:hypothetical protein